MRSKICLGTTTTDEWQDATVGVTAAPAAQIRRGASASRQVHHKATKTQNLPGFVAAMEIGQTGRPVPRAGDFQPGGAAAAAG